jgi:hypothetical protein
MVNPFLKAARSIFSKPWKNNPNFFQALEISAHVATMWQLANQSAPARLARRRPGMSQQTSVHIGVWVRRGWALFRNNMTTLVILLLLFVALFIAPTFFAAKLLKTHHLGLRLLSVVVSVTIAGPLEIGFYRLILSMVDNRQPLTPGETFGCVLRGFESFPAIFLLQSMRLVAHGGMEWLTESCLPHFPALLLQCLWVFVVDTVWLFAACLIADQRSSFSHALGASFQVVRRSFFHYALFNVVLNLILFAGTLACCIGLLFAGPLVLCIIAVAYGDVFNRSAGDLIRPPVLAQRWLSDPRRIRGD